MEFTSKEVRDQKANGCCKEGTGLSFTNHCQSPWLPLTTVEDTGVQRTKQMIQQLPHTKATVPAFVFNIQETQANKS